MLNIPDANNKSTDSEEKIHYSLEKYIERSILDSTSNSCLVIILSKEFSYWMNNIVPQLKEKGYRVKRESSTSGDYLIEWGEPKLSKNKIISYFQLRKYL